MKFVSEQKAWVNDIVALASSKISKMYNDQIAKLAAEEAIRFKRALVALLLLRNVPVSEITASGFDDVADRVASWLSSNRKGNTVASKVINDIQFVHPVKLLSTEGVKDSAAAFKAAGCLGFILACVRKDLSYVTSDQLQEFDSAADRFYPEADKVFAHYPSISDAYPEFEARALLKNVRWDGDYTEAEIKDEWAARLAASAFGQLLKAAAIETELDAAGAASFYLDEPGADGDDPFEGSAFSAIRLTQYDVLCQDGSENITVVPRLLAGQLWQLIVEGKVTCRDHLMIWHDTISSVWRADSPTQAFMAACRYVGACEGVYDMMVQNTDQLLLDAGLPFMDWITSHSVIDVTATKAHPERKPVVHLAHGGQLQDGVYTLWSAVTHKVERDAQVSVLEQDPGAYKQSRSFKLHMQNDKRAVADDLVADKKLAKAPSDASKSDALLCYVFSAEEVAE